MSGKIAGESSVGIDILRQLENVRMGEQVYAMYLIFNITNFHIDINVDKLLHVILLEDNTTSGALCANCKPQCTITQFSFNSNKTLSGSARP